MQNGQESVNIDELAEVEEDSAQVGHAVLVSIGGQFGEFALRW